MASIVSVVGAAVGDSYRLSLERYEMYPGSFIYDYTLRWGVDGNMNAVYLGTSWPPSMTTITGPESSGAGTLNLQWMPTPPTMSTTTGTVAIATVP